jgi:RNA recognition motif-containing protein
MNKYQLVVSELSWNTTEQKLKSIFSKIGKVDEVTLITDSNSGISLGQAYVSMCNEADADKAVAKLDSEKVDGREIRIFKTTSNEKGFKKAFLLNA